MKILLVLFSLFLLPLYVAWFFVISLPIVLPVILLLGSLFYIGYKIYLHYNPLYLEIYNLTECLKDRLSRFAAPIYSCSCAKIQNNKVVLYSQLVTASGSWSHKTVGPNMSVATLKMERKLGCMKECNRIYQCANFKECPNRIKNSKYKEIIRTSI